MASAGDRNADDAKDSHARPAAGGHASRAGAGIRRPQGRRRSAPDGSGGRRRSDRLHSRTGRLPAGAAGAARSPRRRRSRRPPASWWSACGTRTRRAPVLVGLRYRAGQTPLLTREWTSDAVGQGPIASPVLSADGSTVYVNGRDEHLWALNTADGKPKWSVPLDYLAQTPPSVSPDGLIVAGGGPGAKLVAVARRRRPRRRAVDPRRRRPAVRRRAGRAAASATPSRKRRRQRSGAAGVRPGRRPHRQQLPAAAGDAAGRSACRSAMTAVSSPPPATARSTASRRRRRYANCAASVERGTRRLNRSRGLREQLALAEEEDQRVVGQREVLVLGRVEPDAGRDAVDHALLLLQVPARRPGRSRRAAWCPA